MQWKLLSARTNSYMIYHGFRSFTFHSFHFASDIFINITRFYHLTICQYLTEFGSL